MAVLGCLIVLWMRFGAPADNSLAPTDAGTRLISQHFPRQWGDTLTLAIRSAQPVTSPAVRERVTSALTPLRPRRARHRGRLPVSGARPNLGQPAHRVRDRPVRRESEQDPGR